MTSTYNIPVKKKREYYTTFFKDQTANLTILDTSINSKIYRKWAYTFVHHPSWIILKIE